MKIKEIFTEFLPKDGLGVEFIQLAKAN